MVFYRNHLHLCRRIQEIGQKKDVVRPRLSWLLKMYGNQSFHNLLDWELLDGTSLSFYVWRKSHLFIVLHEASYNFLTTIRKYYKGWILRLYLTMFHKYLLHKQFQKLFATLQKDGKRYRHNFITRGAVSVVFNCNHD